ncbi:MAG: FAD-dependent monooxygenase [Eubacteriales bacterium]
MNTHDVVIIGAGPSGISAGITLLRNGVDCLIIDKCEFPRFKLCGGLLTAKTLTHLKLQGIHEIHDILVNTCKKVCIARKNEYIADLKCSESLHLVHRPTFDKLLLDKFIKQGGEFLQGEVIAIDKINKTITLSNQEAISYSHLIGADGANGITQQYVRTSKLYYAKGCGIIIPKKKLTFNNDRILINLGLFHDGFLCEFPKGDSITIGCLCSQSKHDSLNLPVFFQNYLQTQHNYAVEINEIKQALVPYNWHCTEITNHQGSILLVGDTGGYSTCIPGDGIYGALISGEFAATAIIHSKTSSELSTVLYQKSMQPHINYYNRVYNNVLIFYAWNEFFLNVIKKNQGLFASFLFDTQIAYNTYHFNYFKIILAWWKVKHKYVNIHKITSNEH